MNKDIYFLLVFVVIAAAGLSYLPYVSPDSYDINLLASGGFGCVFFVSFYLTPKLFPVRR